MYYKIQYQLQKLHIFENTMDSYENVFFQNKRDSILNLNEVVSYSPHSCFCFIDTFWFA